MNNRYKELANEATVWCEQNAKGTPVAWEWEAKFAELVVQECMQQITRMMDYSDYVNPDLQAIELKIQRDIRQVIKEHFGLN